MQHLKTTLGLAFLLAAALLACLSIPRMAAASALQPGATPTATATLTPTLTLTPTPTATVRVPDIHQTDNFLVLGTDQRPGWTNWRSDTIMVVAVDYTDNKVGIISIPRDLYVNIPGYGMSRINQADYWGETHKYPGGGPALVSRVLEENLGIKTGHWVRIKQDGLVELVNALGGVTVTLDCPLRELTPDPAHPGRLQRFELPAGQVFLDGPTAKKFATFRYASNDFARARRQQQLIWAIRDRALQIDALPKIPELWQALSQTFTTDLGLLDVIRLARLGSQLQADQVRGVTFSSKSLKDTTLASGAMVLTVRNKAALLNEVNSLFQGKPISQQGREGSGRCPAAAGGG
jgi:polyisoprenyl-teichoic acid--peptidoglycan teichoic acid transferase